MQYYNYNPSVNELGWMDAATAIISKAEEHLPCQYITIATLSRGFKAHNCTLQT